MNPIIPTPIDFANIRSERQHINNQHAYQCIKNKDLSKHINLKEWARVCQEQPEIPESELLHECANNDRMAKILAGRIAINASRQGTKDEDLQLQICNRTSIQCGIHIENLSATAFRPTKMGEILSNKDIKTRNIPKNDCLKSFDAKISGKIEGWIFAKAVFGDGGHQDNVFEEAHTFCEWVLQFGKENEIYIVLCDTNLTIKFDELKQKYTGHSNLILGNHITIQQYFIDTYSTK